MNKKILIPVIALLVIAVGLFSLEKLKVTNLIQNNDSSQQIDGPDEQEKQAEAKVNADAKKELIEGEAPDKGETPTSGSTPQSTLIELSAQQETNGTVTVFTKLFNITSGTCNLSITNGSRQVTQTAPIAFQPEYSSCAGFSVNQSNLGTGDWVISISVNSNGQSTAKTIFFKVQ